jgi:protein phosphatase
MVSSFEIKAAGLTDKGQVRTNNEDAFYIAPSLDLFLVADGMGGHAGGEVASSTIVEVVTAEQDRVASWSDSAQELQALLTRTDTAVRERAVGDLTNMGSTIVALYFKADRYWVAHAGDSRAYQLHNGTLNRLTTDHTPDTQFNNSRPACMRSGIITRAVGVGNKTEFDVSEGNCCAHDRFLLCSDGLTDAVTEAHIWDRLQRTLPPAEIVSELITAANVAGGPDNITVVVVDIL